MLINSRTFSAYSIDDLKNWQLFLESELGKEILKVHVPTEYFSGNANITLLPQGEKVITIDATNTTIYKHPQPQSTLMGLVYSDVQLKCGCNNKSIEVDCKDTLLFNNQSSFSLQSDKELCVLLLLLPLSRFGNDANDVVSLFNTKKVSELSYGQIINNLLSACFVPEGLEEKISIIIDIIKISAKNSLTKNNIRYQYILNKIHKNSLNPDFSLAELAQQCSMSPRTIQYILSSQNNTFHQAISKIRLEILCKNIHQMKGGKLSDIVSQSGFSSLLNASRCFQKFYHTTLTSYYLQYK